MTSGPGTGMKSALSGVLVGHHQPFANAIVVATGAAAPGRGALRISASSSGKKNLFARMATFGAVGPKAGDATRSPKAYRHWPR